MAKAWLDGTLVAIQESGLEGTFAGLFSPGKKALQDHPEKFEEYPLVSPDFAEGFEVYSPQGELLWKDGAYVQQEKIAAPKDYAVPPNTTPHGMRPEDWQRWCFEFYPARIKI